MQQLLSPVEIAANIAAVRGRVRAAAERAGRDPASVRLVAVSKTFPPEAVMAACDAGQTEFGENRVQEGAEKIPAVAAAGYAPIWHLIGHLQTNKVRAAAGLFGIIQSIDSLRLAEALNGRVDRRFPILVEINVAGEASKSGLPLANAPETVAAIRALRHLNVLGLMTVAPAVGDPEGIRPVFRTLAELARRLDLPELSMGMSGDFEVAAEEGATILRVGTAIFGRRA